jgi:hypothetical protein
MEYETPKEEIRLWWNALHPITRVYLSTRYKNEIQEAGNQVAAIIKLHELYALEKQSE